MTFGFFVLLQLIIEPLQYFGHPGIILGFIPPFYIGRVYTIIVFFTLLITKKSDLIFKSFKKALLNKPYCYFSLWTILAGTPYLIKSDSLQAKLRYAIIEPLTTLIYLALFGILPSLIATRKDLINFKKPFIRVIMFVLLLGYIDYILSLFGFQLIGRTIFDPTDIGSRFHSLLNEPRDYVVGGIYYFSSLSVLSVSPLFKQSNITFKLFSKSSILVGLIILSLFLTYSTTFLVGLGIAFLLGSLLILLKNINIIIRRFSIKKTIFILPIIISLLLILIMNYEIILPKRILLMIQPLLENIPESYDELVFYLISFKPYRLQISAILPLFDALNIKDISDVSSLIFGHGHGYIANYIGSLLTEFRNAEITNSYSSLSRLISETGLIGLITFLYMFLRITYKSFGNIVSTKRKKLIYLLTSILMISMYLAHRRQEVFLFIGLVNCYLNKPYSESQIIKKS